MKKKIFFVVCLLLGLMFINAGLNKFFNYIPVPEDLPEPQVRMFMAMIQIKWLMPLVGAAEVLGGILLIIPRLRALGALILCPILAGIILTCVSVAPEGFITVLLVTAAWTWVVVENRERYLAVVKG